DKPILSLTPEELASLNLQPASLARLAAVRAALSGLNAAAPMDELVEQGLAALGALVWMQTEPAGFTLEERGRWLAALRDWQRGLRELEAVLAIERGASAASPQSERLSLAEAVAD